MNEDLTTEIKELERENKRLKKEMEHYQDSINSLEKEISDKSFLSLEKAKQLLLTLRYAQENNTEEIDEILTLIFQVEECIRQRERNYNQKFVTSNKTNDNIVRLVQLKNKVGSVTENKKSKENI